MIPGITAGRNASPIKIVFQDAVGFDSSAATFVANCPDPSPYIAVGDVVIYTCSVMNGFVNEAGSNSGYPVGGLIYNSAYYGDANRGYSTIAFARRITAVGTIGATARRFSFFVNFTGSSVVATTTVLRGVFGTGTQGIQLGADTDEGLGADFYTQNAAMTVTPAGNASERTVVRANARSLAIAHHYVFSSGTIGGKPAGWKDGLNYAGPGSNSVVSESRYFPSIGTTTTVARSPRPFSGNSGVLLMHVYAS